MTKCLLYLAPIAVIGLTAAPAPAAPAVWGGGMARNIAAATADARDARLVLVRGGGFRGGGGGFAGGSRGGFSGGGGRAGGGSWAGVSGGNRGNFNNANVNRGNFNSANVNRGNFNSANVNVNRNVNVSGGGYYGPGWGGVAAGVAAGAVVGAAAASTPYYYPPAPAYPYNCPYPNYPNCGL